MKKYGRKIRNSSIALYVSIALTVLIVFFSFYYAYGKYCTTLISDKQKKAAAYTVKNKTQEHGKIVFYGDSITEMCDTDTYYPDLDIVNRGISGDTTAGMLERLENNLLSIEPSTVLFLGGINDVDKNISVEEITNNIENIVSQIKTRLPECKVIVQSVYPVNKEKLPRYLNKVNNRDNDKVHEINQRLPSICEKYGCLYIDINKILSDEQGNLNSRYTRDGLHLTKKAYFAISHVITPYIAPSV